MPTDLQVREALIEAFKILRDQQNTIDTSSATRIGQHSGQLERAAAREQGAGGLGHASNAMLRVWVDHVCLLPFS